MRKAIALLLVIALSGFGCQKGEKAGSDDKSEAVRVGLVLSVGGLGVREGAAVILFGQAGVDEAAAVAASLAVYIVTTVLTGLLGGLIYLARGMLGMRE